LEASRIDYTLFGFEIADPQPSYKFERSHAEYRAWRQGCKSPVIQQIAFELSHLSGSCIDMGHSPNLLQYHAAAGGESSKPCIVYVQVATTKVQT
jgi:hypothetical protein